MDIYLILFPPVLAANAQHARAALGKHKPSGRAERAIPTTRHPINRSEGPGGEREGKQSKNHCRVTRRVPFQTKSNHRPTGRGDGHAPRDLSFRLKSKRPTERKQNRWRTSRERERERETASIWKEQTQRNESKPPPGERPGRRRETSKATRKRRSHHRVRDRRPVFPISRVYEGGTKKHRIHTQK